MAQTDSTRRTRPVGNRFARGLRTFGLGLGLAGALAACESGAKETETGDEAGAAGPALEQLEMDRAVPQFLAIRLDDMADRRLAEHVAKNESTKARQLCEIARRRSKQMAQEAPDASDFVAAWKRVDEVCGTLVAASMMKAFVERAANVGESQREFTCQAGSGVLAFVHTHRYDTDENLALRKEIFAACPSLEVEWNYVEEGKTPDSTGGAPVPNMPKIPGMPDMPPPRQPPPPRDGAPTEGAPTDGGPTDGAPAERAPTEGAPTDGAPAEGTPTEGTPAPEAPSEAAPE